MRCTYLIFVALLGYHVQGASIQNETPKTITKRLVDFVQAKCSNNTNNDNIINAVQQVKQVSYMCWNHIIPDLRESVEKSKQTCHEHASDVLQCVTDLAEKLEPCLELEEQFLKEFILDGYRNYSDCFCENIETLFQPITTKGSECIRKFTSNRATNPHMVCYAKSKIFGNNAPLKVITKSDLCQDLNNILSCYEEMFDEECPGATEVKEFHLGIMGGGLKQCTEE